MFSNQLERANGIEAQDASSAELAMSFDSRCLLSTPLAEALTVSVVGGRSGVPLTRDRAVVKAACEPAGTRRPVVALTQRSGLSGLLLI